MDRLKRVLIVAGGTGGHVFPGLTVARSLQEKGVEVHWLGTGRGLEARVAAAALIPMDCLAATGLRGKGAGGRLRALFHAFTDFFRVMGILRRFRPNAVLAMGGYVSGPAGVAAWLLRYPLVIHEQNALPGLTNRCLARIATRVLEGFSGAFPRKIQAIATGNPVRPDILAVGRAAKNGPIAHAARPLQLLVLGGSLGAARLNALVPAAIQLMTGERPVIWHQSGERHFSDTLRAFEPVAAAVTVFPFIEDMAAALAFADIVLCRAGALTVAELCAAGRGGILVPWPHAVDNHQAANAAFMAEGGAARMLSEQALDAAGLASILGELTASPELCRAMGAAAWRLCQADAAESIVRVCREVSR